MKEDFIRTPLSLTGFYRIHPDGTQKWEEFVLVPIPKVRGWVSPYAWGWAKATLDKT